MNATGPVAAELPVEDERVAALVKRGVELGSSYLASADIAIDAAGLLVVPGGVDGRTHMDLLLGATR